MAYRGTEIVSLQKMDGVKSPINRDRLKGAVKAVLENLKKLDGESRILDPVHKISLVVKMHKRISHNITSLFKLPHPVFNRSTEICIFTRDISLKDPDRTVESYERRFKHIKSPIKFIPFTTLKREYNTPEAKRHLARSFGIFVIEARLKKFIWRHLGRDFFSSHAARNIRLLDFGKEDLRAVFRMTLNSTVWSRSGVEFFSKIYVAPSNFSVDYIVDNLDACIKGVAFSAMRGWDNIRYLHVTGPKTLRYPLYANEEPPKEIEILDHREAIRQYMETRKIMKGPDLYTMSDREIKGMFLKRLRAIKPHAKPPKKRTKMDDDVEETVDNDEESDVDVDPVLDEEKVETVEEPSDEDSEETDGEDVDFED